MFFSLHANCFIYSFSYITLYDIEQFTLILYLLYLYFSFTNKRTKMVHVRQAINTFLRTNARYFAFASMEGVNNKLKNNKNVVKMCATVRQFETNI